MTELSTAPMITALFASVAWFLSLFGGVYCKFLTNTLTTSNEQEGITLSFGIWTYQGYLLVSDADSAVVYQTCKSYPDGMYLDPKWKTAMAMSTMTIVIGAALTVWSLFAICSTPSKMTFRWFGIMFLLCCLFEGNSLLLLSSTACTNNELTAALQAELPLLQLEDTCAMSVGAKCTIAAVVLWFLAAVPALKVGFAPLSAVDNEKNAATDNKVIDPDSKLFDKEQAADAEDIGDEHTLETTEAA